MILGLEFCRRHVADRLEQPAIDEPVDPFERCGFHLVEMAPRAAAASLAEFDWGCNPRIPKRARFELNALKFIAEGECAILIGPPGTGKSHVAKAIAHSAVRTGMHVPYREADELLASLLQLSSAGKRKLVKPAIDAGLLVLDDLFMARGIAQEATDGQAAGPARDFHCYRPAQNRRGL